MDAKVIIALGSNLGNKKENLEKAIDLLSERGLVKEIKRSSIYESEPYGWDGEADNFFNAVISGITQKNPLDLLSDLKQIEHDMGRKSAPKNAPRIIDLDILFYEDKVIDTPELTVPHPGITQREFVLVPLCEIEPGLIHPVIGKSTCELLELLTATEGRVIRLLPW